MTPVANLQQTSGALFSGCRHYRHVLWRSWAPEKGVVTFIGLNPSTADADQDDPTIRRCRNFVADWGFGAMIMVNLFDVRATQPEVMKRRARPLSRNNDSVLVHAATQANKVVAAWGVHGHHRSRSDSVRSLLENHGIHATCFDKSKCGEPVHPLYQRRERTADVPL